MARSNAELVEAFVNGATHGTASNMRIAEGPVSHNGETAVLEGETALIGYEWAVYAKRTSNGRVVVFNGWRQWAKDKPGHSGSSTIHHISLIENAAGPTHILKADNPKSASPPNSAKTMRSPRNQR